MKDIVYYVACSLDGYIAGENDDISAFAQSGNGVDKYLADLKNFNVTIMGRKTYEFGYQYGLKPGQAAYPHMEHHIFSDSLTFDDKAENVHIEAISLDRVNEIKSNATSDIYLCGGGQFAAWLLENDLIDRLIIKLNPIIIGKGIKLFGESSKSANLELLNKESFEFGLQFLSYRIKK